MGLFDWLTNRKGKVEVAEDRIWLTREAKLAGVRKDVAAAVDDPSGPSAIFVIAHFKDCLEQVRESVAGLNQDRILVTLAESLAGRTPNELVADDARSILIVAGERHPLPSHDEDILDFAGSLPCRCRLAYHLSLQDPFMLRFAGEWVDGLLRRMGMKDDEAVASPMINRRVRSAQRKIAKVAAADPSVDSAEEWFERNRR